MSRANYIGAPQFFNLNNACRVLVDAFGVCIYLVGSSLERRDFRDVDVRCILKDADFDRMFPNIGDTHFRDARWSVLSASISLWLSQCSGLPVDFQFQKRTEANAEFHGPRCAIGIFLEPPA